MKLPFLFLFLVAFVGVSVRGVAQAPEQEQELLVSNYDESQVGPYTLPDPLAGPDGRRITTATAWERQRPAIRQLFADHVYGQMPGRPKGMRFVVRAVEEQALGGTAVRKQVAIVFADGAPPLEVLLYLPKGKRRVPVFLGLNFYGNHCIDPDPGIRLSTRWMRDTDDGKNQHHRATEAARGMQAARWPVADVLRRGYGVATAYYGDLEPDHPAGWKEGVRGTLQAVTGLPEQAWGAIGAWAWGLSRVLDYLETEPAVAARRVVVHGHSRLGKAALWAGANDPRFAAVIANCSGEAGAALARRNYGETIGRITHDFPWWFVARYQTYARHVSALPVDQHLLLALVAPRPLYVATASEDHWADTKGQWLSAVAAGPVYALYGQAGVGGGDVPAVGAPVGHTIRFHIRPGPHNITPYDWAQYLPFMDGLVR